VVLRRSGSAGSVTDGMVVDGMVVDVEDSDEDMPEGAAAHRAASSPAPSGASPSRVAAAGTAASSSSSGAVAPLGEPEAYDSEFEEVGGRRRRRACTADRKPLVSYRMQPPVGLDSLGLGKLPPVSVQAQEALLASSRKSKTRKKADKLPEPVVGQPDVGQPDPEKSAAPLRPRVFKP
jgi:hypothetical protein